MIETVEIPFLAAKAANPDGYWEVFRQFCRDGITQEAAYEKTEQLLEKHFGYRRYSNYVSFRRTMSHRGKK